MSALLEPAYHDPLGTLVRLPNEGIHLAQGAGAPTASAVGYAKGCLYIDRTNGTHYINSGSATSATWVATTGALTPSSVVATGAITTSSPSASFGFATGAGGSATQATNRSTGVTITGNCGLITTDTTSLAAEAAASFKMTNTSIAVGDVVVVSQRSGSNGGNTAVNVTGVAAGACTLQVSNNNAAAGTAETGAILINFAVVKAVSA